MENQAVKNSGDGDFTNQTQNKDLKNVHFCAYVRHGERADEVYSYEKCENIVSVDQENEMDPPLTKRGLDQAIKTGQFLREYFIQNKYHFTDVIINSSPYIRTIMTASGIAQGLFGDQHEVKIQIDSHLMSLDIRQFPRELIEIAKPFKDQDELRKLLKDYGIGSNINVDIESDSYRDSIVDHYPEDHKHGFNRAFMTHGYVMDKIKEMKKEGGVCVINVCHGKQVKWAAGVNQLYEDSFASQKQDHELAEYLTKLQSDIKEQSEISKDDRKQLFKMFNLQPRRKHKYGCISAIEFKLDQQQVMKDVEVKFDCDSKHCDKI